MTNDHMTLNLLMLGPPGAGKGTQSERLARTRGIPKISTGEILRQAVHAGTEVGERAKAIMDRGELVSDEVMIGIVKERLEREDGLSVEVVDLRTLLPLDDEAIVATVKKTNRVLIVHEDTRTGGAAGEITARINDLAFEWLDAPVRRVCAHDVPLPYAPTLEDFVLPQVDDVVAAARWMAGY